MGDGDGLGRVTNGDGWVALQHWNSNPKTVSIDTVYYVFAPQHNVSLAFVRPEHVDRILAIQEKSCNCGGGRNRNSFHLVSPINYSIWLTGTR